MKKALSVLTVSIFLLLSFSCSRKIEGVYDTIPYVDAILSDSLSGLKNLAGCSGKSSGVIALIGDPRSCLVVGEKLMTSDEFDNIDGRKVPDGLPDFAGETIVTLLDFVNPPYEGYLETEEGRGLLREITVKNALAMLDTVCLTNPYDRASFVSKGAPKLLLLCSPVLYGHGREDVVDLFRRIGCEVPVVCSADTSFSFSEASYRILRDMNIFTHNIAYPSADLYMTIPETNLPAQAYSSSGEMADSYKYSRVSGSHTPTFMAISFSDRYVPQSFPDTVGVLAHKTLESYVQNKY